jgi:hypothetical protein
VPLVTLEASVLIVSVDMAASAHQGIDMTLGMMFADMMLPPSLL